MTSGPDESTPDDVLQPEISAPRDRQEHGKSPRLDEEVLDSRAAEEEAAVRADAGESSGPQSFDRDAVPDAED